MSSVYYIEPEVAGELGDGTVMNSSVHPPVVKKLELCFSGWLGDDLLECYPCFIVTERLANELKNTVQDNIFFEKIIVTQSDEFNEIYPGKPLPNFYWMKFINGKEIFLSEDQRLAVSEHIMNTLNNFNISNAIIEKV
ncbi:hypothetical protein [Pectobacterium brasiliense]|uniref:hypothetical protein n=1 Tax=Pectobacterium brasiliense TaxID=180957 RepID=UPI0001A44229|nr:hypothetical protein [Pectobacterium brasiliense]KGA23064.1 hypothetical protein KS44_15580 [Pectobacterium brasiliense]KRF60461.1 hypothetical protein AO825_14820 [Pectobacterium brasiliense]MBN3143571.1 hypothetical protein [Pectobacterium brasiliense]MBN3187166.1 hypothetical protein [Pectobacterium brasiliense]QHG27933.1 hypothetical protein GT391_07585 [Pectobacterium brasiliense]